MAVGMTAIMIVLSLGLVAVATRSLPLGTAYAVWTGIGAVGAVGVWHCAGWGVCGFQQAGSPWAVLYGNSRVETDWRITQHTTTARRRVLATP